MKGYGLASTKNPIDFHLEHVLLPKMPETLFIVSHDSQQFSLCVTLNLTG